MKKTNSLLEIHETTYTSQASFPIEVIKNFLQMKREFFQKLNTWIPFKQYFISFDGEIIQLDDGCHIRYSIKYVIVNPEQKILLQQNRFSIISF